MTDLAAANDAAWSASAKTRMGLLLALWFALAALIGVTGAVAAGPDTLFRPIALTMVVPVLAFVALYLGSATFRGFVLGRDLRFVTLLQSWRVVGFAFLPLYFFGVLPGLFAWPAGVGDVLVGLGAPWAVFALLRDPAFATSRAFVVWNVPGPRRFHRRRRDRGARLGRDPGPRRRRRDQRADGAVAAHAVPEFPRAAVRHRTSDGAVPGPRAASRGPRRGTANRLNPRALAPI